MNDELIVEEIVTKFLLNTCRLRPQLTLPAAQRLDLFAWCVRLSRLLVGFRTHFKSLHFHSFIHSYTLHWTAVYWRRKLQIKTQKLL